MFSLNRSFMTSKHTKQIETHEWQWMGNRIPDFIIIGSMKSGTSTLYEYLSRHLEIFMAVPKEPQFFSRDEVYGRGIHWYRTLFAGARPGQVCGEASTCYTRLLEYPQAADRLAQHVPEAKLIYVMRHPVERAYSHYVHLMGERWNSGRRPLLTFEDALEEYPTILDTSNYCRQIMQYFRYFPRRNLFLCTLEDLESHPSAILEAIQAFLGVTPRGLPSGDGVHINKRGRWMAEGAARKRYLELKQQRWARVLLKALPSRGRGRLEQYALELVLRSRYVAREVAAFQADLAPVHEQTRMLLLQQFRDSTLETEKLLGRPLKNWLE